MIYRFLLEKSIASPLLFSWEPCRFCLNIGRLIEPHVTGSPYRASSVPTKTSSVHILLDKILIPYYFTPQIWVDQRLTGKSRSRFLCPQYHYHQRKERSHVTQQPPPQPSTQHMKPCRVRSPTVSRRNRRVFLRPHSLKPGHAGKEEDVLGN